MSLTFYPGPQNYLFLTFVSQIIPLSPIQMSSYAYTSAPLSTYSTPPTSATTPLQTLQKIQRFLPISSKYSNIILPVVMLVGAKGKGSEECFESECLNKMQLINGSSMLIVQTVLQAKKGKRV